MESYLLLGYVNSLMHPAVFSVFTVYVHVGAVINRKGPDSSLTRTHPVLCF